ncbi:MAG: hypothetical protein ABH831_01615 [Candidatus Nealsonbacteria bacterium]
MKIKILAAGITFAILAALSVAGFYIYKSLNQPIIPAELPAELPEEENPPAGGEEVSEEVLKEIKLLKDDFEITLPPGWQEETNSYEGILLLAIDSKEDVSDGIFQKLDFRTSLSIKSDDITKYAGVSSFEDYVASIKTSLVQVVPGIKFVKEEGNILECESTQEDADFKTLLVFIEGNDSTVYALSFNTFMDSWPAYKSLFYWMADSFKLRYNI